MVLGETAEYVWTVTDDTRLGVEADVTAGKVNS